MVVYLELAFLFSSVVVANGLKAFLCNNNETSKIKVSTQIKPCEPVSLSETVNKPIQVIQILPKLEINAVSCRILRSSIESFRIQFWPISIHIYKFKSTLISLTLFNLYNFRNTINNKNLKWLIT